MQKIIIDPAYKVYYEDRLFDENNQVLNRDDSLAPFIRLKKELEKKDIYVCTADRLMNGDFSDGEELHYYSFGVIDNYAALMSQAHIKLCAFIIYEPPIVSPILYQELPQLTTVFERVYVHNTEGNGYSLSGVNQSKLRKLFWPQPRVKIIDGLWSNNKRESRVVMINGNHKPTVFAGELYSKRIEVMVELATFGLIDLFGTGWNRWWSRNSMWWPYWKNKRSIDSIYKGTCLSKYEVLSRYKFALCFENMEMKGYVTEKIFDCLYAGCIPIYLGSTDIESLIPEDCFIDYRKFANDGMLVSKLLQMSDLEIKKMKLAGKKFIESEQYFNYFNSLSEIVVAS